MVSDKGENWLTRRFNVNDIIIRKKTFGGEKSLRQKSGLSEETRNDGGIEHGMHERHGWMVG